MESSPRDASDASIVATSPGGELRFEGNSSPSIQWSTRGQDAMGGGYRPDSNASIMCDPMSVVPTAWPPGAAMSRVR